MSKYVCIQTCEWYKDGVCIRNPYPYGRLRKLQTEPEAPKPIEPPKPIERDKQKYICAVIGTDKDGNQIRFKNAAEASRALGLNKSAVTNAIHKKGCAGGFRWRKENE